MKRVYSAAYLTYAPLNPPDAVRVAALYGYDAVGFRILPAAPGGPLDDLIGNKAMLRETKAALAQTGVSVFDVEIVRIGENFVASKYAAFLETCGELGAKSILVAGDDPDEGRLTANYAAFCEAALPYDLTADLEFMPFTPMNDCRAAMRILGAAQQPNGGILVDALHVARSTTSNADLAAIPRKWLHYCQVCDALPGLKFSLEEMIYNARSERFLPGEKSIDIAGMLQALPADLPISVEIPSAPRKQDLGVLEWCRLSLEASRKFGG
jgi:sugar phosphate isomerase/epimerase